MSRQSLTLLFLLVIGAGPGLLATQPAKHASMTGLKEVGECVPFPSPIDEEEQGALDARIQACKKRWELILKIYPTMPFESFYAAFTKVETELVEVYRLHYLQEDKIDGYRATISVGERQANIKGPRHKKTLATLAEMKTILNQISPRQIENGNLLRDLQTSVQYMSRDIANFCFEVYHRPAMSKAEDEQAFKDLKKQPFKRPQVLTPQVPSKKLSQVKLNAVAAEMEESLKTGASLHLSAEVLQTWQEVATLPYQPPRILDPQSQKLEASQSELNALSDQSLLEARKRQEHAEKREVEARRLELGPAIGADHVPVQAVEQNDDSVPGLSHFGPLRTRLLTRDPEVLSGARARRKGLSRSVVRRTIASGQRRSSTTA